VAGTFAGRARAARLALIDGAPGLAWYHQGVLRVVFAFTLVEGTVTGIELISEPDHLARLAVVPD
jgi:RNA polymerase sigma-70 factor (ECF subfamily)